MPALAAISPPTAAHTRMNTRKDAAMGARHNTSRKALYGGVWLLRRGRNTKILSILFVGAFIISLVVFIIALRRGSERLPLYISGATMVMLVAIAVIAVMIAYL